MKLTLTAKKVSGNDNDSLTSVNFAIASLRKEIGDVQQGLAWIGNEYSRTVGYSHNDLTRLEGIMSHCAGILTEFATLLISKGSTPEVE